MRSLLPGFIAGFFIALAAPAQILMSGGTYSQNFDVLATSGTVNWTNDLTLPGWYAAKGSVDAPTYIANAGTTTTGSIYSFGTNGVNSTADRALGSVAGSSTAYASGVRFTNDTGLAVSNLTISFTGEQWRNASGANGVTNTLAFSYQIANAPLTNADAVNAENWMAFGTLDFKSPFVNTNATSGSPLDGNVTTNRLTFVNVLLAGVAVAAGQEIFLRWRDVDDTGNDAGMAIDDFSLNFQTGTTNATSAPLITLQPQSQSVDAGSDVTFSIAATGTPAPVFQWRFNGTNLVGETNAVLALSGVSTNQAGGYNATVSNLAGSTNSQTVTLAVNVVVTPPVGVTNGSITLMTYNVKGNGATNWSTNAVQVQAIGRSLQHLQPDVITFNEIPWDLRYEMTNFTAAFLPGYQMAVSSGTDGSICSAIASRHPIARASKWLDGVDLRSFGYSNANNSLDNFTRDLFEAQINVPGFPRPLHVFTTHLKATASAAEYADNALKRAAEAAAITNFFATNLFVLFPYDLYVLAGDMNASDTNELCIQTLISPATRLILTDPKNSVTGSVNTYSTTTANPGSRLDYIFPGLLLYSNIVTGQVFRTDRLTPLPPNLNSNDCKVASDHLPVLMTFANPFAQPFRVTGFTRTNAAVTLQWQSVPGGLYQLEGSSNLATWTALATNLLTTNYSGRISANSSEPVIFFRVRTQ
jgi:endonuclease/exonuclease/phosphatase family metal-dependent hydrolase